MRVREVLRGDRWFVTEIYDLRPSPPPVAQEVSSRVSECIYGWTAAFRQQGTHISARIRLVPDELVPDEDVPAELLGEVKGRWKKGIEKKWSLALRVLPYRGLPGALRADVRSAMGGVGPAPQRPGEERSGPEQPGAVVHRRLR
ncbi:hypothetical protein [Actinomadura macra]|uniref:hypothetical protein n=1 Tax=Actinomadura macra TaxID=46164 RepID=UPI000B138AD3|nr:hypothetical protein [Actinomadura macra]